MKLLTYLILPELKTYSLNHRSLTNFNQGFMFHSYLVDTAKRIQDRYIVSWIKPKFDKYRRFVSTSLSRLEAHDGFFRLAMKGKFDAYLLWPFGKILISIL